MYSFEEILESKITTGLFQYKTISISGLTQFCNGTQNLLLTLLIKLHAEEWGLDQSQISALGATFFAGLVAGNLLCAQISDRIGRKYTFLIFNALSVIVMYLGSLTQKLDLMLFYRFLLGSTQGINVPLCQIVVSEISIKYLRGRFGLIIQLTYVLGRIFIVFLSFYFLNDYASGNWRGLLKLNCIPQFIAFILIFFLNESARFYLSRSDNQNAFDEIEKAAAMNGNFTQLSDDEKNGLLIWQKNQNELTDNNGSNILSKNYLFVTLLTWGIIIIANQQNLSIYLLMPFLFQSNGSGFQAILYLYIGEFIITLLIYNFIDSPTFGGRIGILFISSLILIIINLLLYVFKQPFLLIGMIFIKLATRIIFSVNFVLVCESYPTRLRTKGLGIAQGIGRFSVVPAPYFIFPIYFISEYLPFLLFSILTIIQTIMISIYPFNKVQKPLE